MMKKTICLLLTVVLLGLCYALPSAKAEEPVPPVQTVEVGIPVEEYPKLFGVRSMPTHGEGKIAVFLIDFPDYPNDNPLATQEYYDKLYFSGGLENNVWGKTVAEFFFEQSYGKLNISGQVFDWYTAKHERSYYDDKKAELVMEAAAYYVAQGVDFAQFDGDVDGVIDSLVYHFAGPEELMQSQSWYSGRCTGTPDGFGMIGGMKFTTMIQVKNGATYLLDAQNSVICHELLHTLGMPDLYGEVYSDATIDLMVSNTDTINPYTKILLGWIDTVQVITQDSEKNRLDVYGNPEICEVGTVAIVTDEFNGFLDEFFVVAYRSISAAGTTPVVWHIDARPNEDGNGFLCSNLDYRPRPDRDDGHNISNVSPYLFIEELSADPNHVFILNGVQSLEQSAFKEDSVLGPNSMPSSDTHDGQYTGIKIYNFIEHNEEYLTFDVSFVEDTDPPICVTQEEALEFKDIISIHFNEYIYEGENWEGVKVTDLDGNELSAKILITHYPRHEIEIAFADDAYKHGYRIVLPDGAVRDSSGNSIEGITLTAQTSQYLLPIKEAQLPGVGEYNRQNGSCYWFPHEEDIVAISGLWGNHTLSAGIELMRLDREGNVLLQTVIDNPVSGSIISAVKETGNGDYIFFCTLTHGSTVNGLFCLDANGNLKWVNDSYVNTEASFTPAYCFAMDKGLVIGFHMNEYHYVFIDAETGEVSRSMDGVEIDDSVYHGAQMLPDGRLLRCRRYPLSDEKWSVSIVIRDRETNSVLAENTMEYSGSGFEIYQSAVNDDGTIMLVISEGALDQYVMLFDADLNCVKTLPLDLQDSTRYINFFENDGFCVVERTLSGDHEDNHYYVRRYDRYLNLMWESDAICNFMHYFKSTTGDIMAYKSKLKPDRECYIEYYGSEEAFRSEHTHNLVHTEGISATCQNDGMAEYWYCTDCGCYYLDEGNTVIANLRELILTSPGHSYSAVVIAPTCMNSGCTTHTCVYCGDTYVDGYADPLGHNYEDVVTAPTCTEGGYTTHHCTRCDESYVDTYTGPLGHEMSEWTITKVPACGEDGEEISCCSRCDYVQARTIESADHIYQSQVTVTPGCETTGIMAYTCTNCGHSYTEEIAAIGHSYDSVVTTPTCTEQGYTTHTCRCGDSYVDTYTDPLGHKMGAWTQTKAPSCTENGEEQRNCSRCGYTETNEIAATEHSYSSVVTEPTCTEQGYTTHTCANCGATYTDTHVEPTGHTYKSERVEPTCTENGSVTYTCHCGDTYTDVISAIGHQYDAVVTEPTCTEDGFTTHTCSNCGDQYTSEVVAAKGHQYTEEVVEPTCSEAGSITYTCVHCGHSYTEAVPTVPHNFVDGACADCGAPEVALGDVNGDGKINARDARALLRYIAGLDGEGKINLAAADFNGDGRINARDARAILRNIAGLD